MGTSNFHKVNAKKVYACMMNEGENNYTSLDYKDFRENIYHLMEDYQECDYHTDSDSQRSMHELRSFYSHYIGSFVSSRYIRDICDIEVQINAFSRCGYYDGINLDYEIKVFINGYEQDEQWKKYFSYVEVYDQMEHPNKGLAKIIYRKVEKWVDSEITRMTNNLEQIFESVCEHKLEVFARFSNGETWYNEAK